jgi:hypothetical protein
MERLSRRATVCAVIPHFECEAWLGQALESLLGQTRPPEAVVVVDDASADPPVDVVRGFPDVTLLAAPDNGGPYRLVQAVIGRTRFDAYLFQDADDWSAPDRLEVLLAAAEETGAELVGSHEVRVLVDEGDLVPVRYPLDVNDALAAKPTAFPLLHPTSMVSRDLVVRVGGFATGMRFSGDAEFLRRAGHAARVVNADHFGYFRRKRPGSLTTAADTALQSPQRREVQATLAERARANADAVARGEQPDLHPWRTAPPARLRRLAGPSLRRPSHSGGQIAQHAARSVLQNGENRAGPVFVIGAPRGGHSLVAWALDQHPRFRALPDARWLARAATAVATVASEEAACPPAGFEQAVAVALADCAGGTTGRRWVGAGTEVTEASPALARLFPQAQFLFVTRDVEQTVAVLRDRPTDGGSFYTHDLAYRQWIHATRMGLDLEAALGRERVLRLDYARLSDDPDTALKECLAFLGEEHKAACSRPFAGLTVRPFVPPRDDGLSPAIIEQVHALTVRLAEPSPDRPDPTVATRLADAVGRGSAGFRRSSLVEKVRETVVQSVPDGAVVLVASRGDGRLLDLDGRMGWHFPQVEGGVYAGHHPANSARAVEHLEELRGRGAEFFVLPAGDLWWLTYYAGLGAHLHERYSVVAYRDDACVVYSLVERTAEPLLLPGPVVPMPPGRDGTGGPR